MIATAQNGGEDNVTLAKQEIIKYHNRTNQPMPKQKIRPMSQKELDVIQKLSIKERATKWKTFIKCCHGASLLPTRREVKCFQSQTGKAWEYYQEQIS